MLNFISTVVGSSFINKVKRAQLNLEEAVRSAPSLSEVKGSKLFSLILKSKEGKLPNTVINPKMGPQSRRRLNYYRYLARNFEPIMARCRSVRYLHQLC